MRNAVKNQSKIWYALRDVYSSQDGWGNTKDITTYSLPVELKISVSANKGEAAAQAFGADLQYDREMVTHDMSCPINEYSKLWIDETSIIDENSKAIHGEGDTIVFKLVGLEIKPDGDTLEINSGSLIATEQGVSVVKAHNYEVVAVSKSLNCIRYAIRRVNVSR